MTTTITRPWPKAVDKRIQDVMRLRNVPGHVRAIVAVEFAAQQVRREGLPDDDGPVLLPCTLCRTTDCEPIVCDFHGVCGPTCHNDDPDAIWLVCDGCGVPAERFCRDCADALAYDAPEQWGSDR